jgi:hypothetical protein
MGRSRQTQTTQQEQEFQQQQSQDTSQQQQQLMMQNQFTQNLQQMLNNFYNTSNQQQQQQQAVNQTTTANLAPFQQPVVEQYFNDLARQYTSGNLTPQFYTGPRVAQPTAAETSARTLASQYATGAGSGLSEAALGANRFLLDPNQILNPSNIPGVQGTRDAITQNVMRSLTEGALPAIRRQSLMNDAYGGSRQGIAEGLAVGRSADALTNALSALDLGVYQQGLGAMQNALGLAPNTYQVGTAPANTLSQVGAAQRADTQANIEAERQAFAERQVASPANTLNLLRSLMGVQGEFGGTQTTAGTSTGTAVASGSQAGQSSSTQMAQQLASMLGLSLADMQAMTTGSASGTSSGTSTTNQSNSPSTLQRLGALASIFMMPFTFGGSAQGLAYG